MRKSSIHREKFIWQPDIDGLSHDVPVDIFIEDGALDGDVPQTHVYLGMGEEKFASKAALKTLRGVGVKALAVVLPFHHLPCEPVNIERTIIEVPHAIAQEMNERAGSSLPISLAGHSQSGGVVYKTASEAFELFDAVVAWSPVGPTTEYLGETTEEAIKEFEKRLLLQNTFRMDQNPFLHPGNIVAGAEIGSVLISDRLRGRWNPKAQYAFDPQLNIIGDMQKLVDNGVDVGLLAPEFDPIFRLEEYQRAMGKAGLDHILQVIPGSHSSPLVAAGKRQVEAVGNWLLESRAA